MEHPKTQPNQSFEDALRYEMHQQSLKAMQGLNVAVDANTLAQQQNTRQLVSAISNIKLPAIPKFDLRGVSEPIIREIRSLGRQLPTDRSKAVITALSEVKEAIQSMDLTIDYSGVGETIQEMLLFLRSYDTSSVRTVKLDPDDLASLRGVNDWRSHQPYITEFDHDQRRAGTTRRGSGITFVGSDNKYKFVSTADPLPVVVTAGGGTDPVGLKNVAGTAINPATEDTLALLLTQLQAINTNTDQLEIKADTINLNVDGIETRLDTLIGKDYATETTLAAVLAALGGGSTEVTLAALLSAFNAEDFATETTLAAVLAALGGGATEVTLAALLAAFSAEDFATETTLAALYAAFGLADFATATNQTNGLQKTMIVDSTGADMDLWHTGDTFTAAADHGLMILAVSDETPNKYRPIRSDADGRIQTHLCNVAHDDFEFDILDFDTSGGTDNIAIVGLALPASGGAVSAIGGAGAVSSQVQRTTLASDDPAVVALQIMDDWDESDRAKVNPIVGQAGVAGNSGVLNATTQRVTIATNDTVATDLTAIRTALQIIDDWDDTDTCQVSGSTAVGGAIARDPITVGGRASYAAPSVAGIADGDVQNNWILPGGAQVVSNPTGTGTTATLDLTLAATAYRFTTTANTWVANLWVWFKGENTGTGTRGYSATAALNLVQMRPGMGIYLGTKDLSTLYFVSTVAGDDIIIEYTLL